MSQKRYYKSLKEAKKVREERNAEGVYKMKYGHHKGMYFVGDYIEYLNIYC